MLETDSPIAKALVAATDDPEGFDNSMVDERTGIGLVNFGQTPHVAVDEFNLLGENPECQCPRCQGFVQNVSRRVVCLAQTSFSQMSPCHPKMGVDN